MIPQALVAYSKPDMHGQVLPCLGYEVLCYPDNAPPPPPPPPSTPPPILIPSVTLSYASGT